MEKLDSVGSRLVGAAYGEMGAPSLEWRGRPLIEEEDRMGTAYDWAYTLLHRPQVLRGVNRGSSPEHPGSPGQHRDGRSSWDKPWKACPLTGDSLACLLLAPKWAAGPCHRPGEGSGPVQGDLLTVLLVAKAHPGSEPK